MLGVFISAVVVTADGINKCAGDQREIKTCHVAECKKQVCIDCLWDDWTPWGPCECVGLRERHRTTKRSNTSCGKPCVGSRVETETCHPSCVVKPQDCHLGPWSSWTPCDTTCGGGERSRERSITQERVGSGRTCAGALKDVTPCGGNSCLMPKQCEVSEWSEWSECSKSCGNGQTERHRSVTRNASDGGLGCTEPLSELTGCNSHSCLEKIDCVWGAWVNWSVCSATCGGGDRSRSRLIKVAPRGGGKLCEPLDMSEVAACQMQRCEVAVDCEFGEWTPWHDCSCSCNGVRARTRHVKQFPEQGGLACSGALKEIQACNTETCGPHGSLPTPHPEKTVDCKLSAWEKWSPCSKTCGGGVRTRSRSVLQIPENGGLHCEGSLQEVDGCNEKPCLKINFTPPPPVEGEPQDCKWSNWGDWGACSASCDGGQKMRQRQIAVMPNAEGASCQRQASVEVTSCNMGGCQCQDCMWGPWSDWGACGCTGIQERHRSISAHFSQCGKPCTGPKVTTQSCHPHCVKPPVSCEWQPWSEWSDCTKECGGGQRERKRHRGKHSQFGGALCTGSSREIETCGRALCEDPIDCVMGNWHSWGTCSSTCGKGERFRTRDIVMHPAYGGKSCAGDVSEVEGCTQAECGSPVDCKWGAWSTFSACSVTCGDGYKTRDRQILRPPSDGGQLCEPLPKSESVLCNLGKCSAEGCVDTQWGPWDDSFGECSASCGGGYQARSRCIKVHGNYCGNGVEGEMTEYRTCNNHPCVNKSLNCVFGSWGAWSDCSCSCNGVQDRARQIAVYPQAGGLGCSGAVKQFEPCNVASCNEGPMRDCELTEWSTWSTCTAKCDGGHQVRDRQIKHNAENGGRPCDGYVREIHPCNTHPCGNRVDCEWGPWSELGACSKSCDGGEQMRYRHIATIPKNGGLPCQKSDNVEVKACNEMPCGSVQYCGWGLWTQWSLCSTTCGNGEQSRQRILRVTHEKPPEVMASGILEQMHGQLLDAHGRFSLEHLVIVFVFAALSTTLVLASLRYFLRRPFRITSIHELAPELLQSRTRDEEAVGLIDS